MLGGIEPNIRPKTRSLQACAKCSAGQYTPSARRRRGGLRAEQAKALSQARALAAAGEAAAKHHNYSGAVQLQRQAKERRARFTALA